MKKENTINSFVNSQDKITATLQPSKSHPMQRISWLARKILLSWCGTWKATVLTSFKQNNSPTTWLLSRLMASTWRLLLLWVTSRYHIFWPCVNGEVTSLKLCLSRFKEGKEHHRRRLNFSFHKYWENALYEVRRTRRMPVAMLFPDL